MSSIIGKKIRGLRKELKMTQLELAGTEMTKSMLSHIETGHANPSMKNLEYIAKRLNKPVAYLLQEDVSSYTEHKEEKQLPMDKILYALRDIDELIKKESYVLANEEIKKLLDSHDYNKNSKIYADITYRMGCCKLGLRELKEGKEIIEQCSNIYVDNMLHIEATRTYMDLIKSYIKEYEYKKSLMDIEKAYEIYNKSINRDIFLEIEMLVVQPAIHFALGDFIKTISVCEKAISLSRENNIYYRLDDAYRILAITYMLIGDFNNFHKNAQEAIKYVEFTGNKLNLAKIYHNYAKYENNKGNPNGALKYLKLLEASIEKKSFYYYLEHGKALYLLGNYDEALEDLTKIDHREKVKYLYDCIYKVTARIYIGLIYGKVGNMNRSIEEIETGISEIEQYTNVEYKGFATYACNELAFAYSSLSEVYSLKGDYENAYTLLKKSRDLNTAKEK